jgi:hypothetical protein
MTDKQALAGAWPRPPLGSPAGHLMYSVSAPASESRPCRSEHGYYSLFPPTLAWYACRD